jgi:hypothetical protein
MLRHNFRNRCNRTYAPTGAVPVVPNVPMLTIRISIETTRTM